MEQNTTKKTFLSVPELAKMLGISRIAAFRKVKKGHIPAHKIGRMYVISMEDALAFVNEGQSDVLTEPKKDEIKKAVARVVQEYGETLKLLGKE
ncbi:MAG: helix-turn-helix domain-containing protein [Patescibacteria group bacterium]